MIDRLQPPWCSRSMHHYFSLLFVAALAMAPPARADEAITARQHYERGTAMFDLGRFAEAAHEYELAFEAKNDPALLFNIGQAYRLDGNYQKALVAYRGFLRRVPDAKTAPEVQ